MSSEHDSAEVHPRGVLPGLARRVSRRRGLGILAALGFGAGLMMDDADAKQRRRRRKRRKARRCAACTPCETCRNGACQPIADNVLCGDGQVCQNGACAQTCDPSVPESCPEGSVCLKAPAPGQASVCGILDDTQCGQPVCASRVNCRNGSICAPRVCDAMPQPRNVCYRLLS